MLDNELENINLVDEINANEDVIPPEVPVEVAELQPMSREEQADSQLSRNEPPQDEVQEEPQPEEKDPNKTAGFYPGANYPLQNLNNTLQGLSAAGLGLVDFGMDALGMLPGAAPVDNMWDRTTRLPNDMHQGMRKFASIVIPSLIGGSMVGAGIKKLPAEMPKIQKALVSAGLFSAEEAAIIGISDVGEEHNMFRALVDMAPDIFGPKGSVPLPDRIVTLDGDSSSVRKWKNIFETAGLSIVASLIGALIKLKGGVKTLGWFEPKDDIAAAYKSNEILKTSDPEKLIRMQEIQEVLSTKALSKQNERNLMDEYMQLEATLDSVDNLEDALRQVEDSKINERDTAAQFKVNNGADPADFDPDIIPILDEPGNARQTIPPGNVARNIADTTAIKTGVSEGDPAPIITESMRQKGLMVGSTSRDAVLGVAEEARDLGRFNALVDGFRFTAKQMNAAAWDIYTSIVDPGASLDDVKALFIQNKDVKSMLLGKFNVEYINEEQARAAAFALRDLTDRYLGRSVAQSSARVMDTLGREASTIAETIQKFSPVVDDNRAMDLIIDKMQFLLDEYALNKYISGWQLRNKNWFDQVPPKEIDTVIEQLTTEFRSAENALHAKNLRFTKTLKELAETNPLAMRPLVDAFAHTNGDVDTLAKLMNWASQQITPTGMLKSPDPKALNLFTRSAWGVVYNNVLSGISALKAGVGNTGQLILKPITGILGHGIWGAADDFEGIKRSMYYHGAVYETNRRALKDAWTMMKKAHKNPELMMKAYRKDFVFQEDKSWDILEDVRNLWEKEGNFGKTIQYDMARTMKDMAKLPGLRYGMTAMVFPDVYAQTHLAHYIARMRAYDDVFTEFGYADPTGLSLAEKAHSKTMFNKDGTMNDKVLQALSGEVSLNLDDGLASWINKGTTAYPITKHLFMFPRTQSNSVKNALSWTPISLIPGINKYAKTIWAKTDDDIAVALAEHGIDFATTPNAKVLFQNLRAEYTGRIAFSSILTKSLWDYAMAGNIRGNGHYSADRRMKERDQLGYIPKTINLGGAWVNFKGVMGVEQVLSILGDMAYYAGDIDQTFIEDWQSKLMWTISATFLNETPLQGLEPLVAAANGDLTGWNRLVAQAGLAYVPLVGAGGVLSNAITSSQKELNGEIHKYVMNRIPLLSSLLPEQIDFWTGEPLNDIDNPILRALNAVSPIKVSGTREPWRVWLESTGWDGLARLRKDSTGSYTYSPEEKEIIYQYMGEQQLYKQLERLMKSGIYNDQVGVLRAHRATGVDLANENIKLKTSYLPVIREIDRIVRNGQLIAEKKLLLASKNDPQLRHIPNAILRQQTADKAMKRGDVNRARQEQKRELETRTLIQMNK